MVDLLSINIIPLIWVNSLSFYFEYVTYRAAVGLSDSGLGTPVPSQDGARHGHSRQKEGARTNVGLGMSCPRQGEWTIHSYEFPLPFLGEAVVPTTEIRIRSYEFVYGHVLPSHAALLSQIISPFSPCRRIVFNLFLSNDLFATQHGILHDYLFSNLLLIA